MMNSLRRTVGLFVLIGLMLCTSGRVFADGTLKIYLLAGQSNMEGQAYTWDFDLTGPTVWNVPTMQYLHENAAYMNSLPDNTFTFKQDFGADYFDARNDVWAVNYLSSNGTLRDIHNVQDPTPGDTSTPTWPTGVQPLSPGFGPPARFNSTDRSMIGPELAMGHVIGNALNDPVLLFKSATGGTDLAVNWRPPSAVADLGGPGVGANYTNTVTRFKEMLDTLDADLADDGKLNNYNNATGYEVAGFVWLQGWNTTNGNQSVYTTAQKIAEYKENLIDLVQDIRASDARISDLLPAIVVESSDQSATLNAQRQAAVDALNAELPGSAVFIETNGLKDVNYGGLNSAGGQFSNSYGFHFHARPENFLQIGYLIGEAVLENGYTGTPIPEPTSLLLLGAGGVVLMRRKRRAK